jgi:hypothetical protein
MRTVVVLAEAAEDIEQARDFYDEQEPGIGDYFADAAVVDIASLAFYHGIHSRHFGFYRIVNAPLSFRYLLPQFESGDTSIRSAGFVA